MPIDQSDRSITYPLKFSIFAGDVVGEAMAHGNISFAYQALEDHTNATSHMQHAHEAFASCLGEDHPNALRAQQALQQMKQQEQ